MPRSSEFRSQKPRSRIIGTEMEYGLPNGLIHPLEVVNHIQQQTGTAQQGPNQTGSYLTNGGRAYQELTKLIEYATPESLGPRDAVISDLAGQELVRRAVLELQEKKGIDPHSFKNGLYRRVGFYVLNQPSGEVIRGVPHYQATGYHENYYAPVWKHKELGATSNFFGSYLGTRAIWAGSGMFYDGKFLTSQKNISVGGVSGGKYCNLSPRVLFRLAPDGGTGFQRVEVRSNEPHRSPYLQWLGFAATSLALRLIEYSPDKEVERLTLDDPVVAAHEVAYFGLDAKIQINGKTINPLDYQHAVFASVDKNINKKVELPLEEKQALEKLLDLTASSEVYLGWYPRWRYLSQKFSDSPSEWPTEKAIYYDMMMDDLLMPFNSLESTFKRTVGIPGNVIDEEVIKRLYVPPQTRARVRAQHAPNIKGWSSWGDGKQTLAQKNPYRFAA